MREILFRGKRVDNGEWVEGYYVKKHFVGFESHLEYEHYILTGDHDYCKKNIQFEVRLETIGQYAGLVDKNCVKIFEGDFIDHYAFYSFVLFEDGMFCIDQNAKTQFEGYRQPMVYHNAKEMEVIGNIHDNPELLAK